MRANYQLQRKVNLHFHARRTATVNTAIARDHPWSRMCLLSRIPWGGRAWLRMSPSLGKAGISCCPWERECGLYTSSGLVNIFYDVNIPLGFSLRNQSFFCSLVGIEIKVCVTVHKQRLKVSWNSKTERREIYTRFHKPLEVPRA